jgi:hypothetical protein
MWANLSDNKKRSWFVNWDGLTAFARQYVYAQLLTENSNVRRTKQTFELFGPFKVSGPELVTVETDFKAIKLVRDGRSKLLIGQLANQIRSDGRAAFSGLVQMHGQMDDFRDSLREMQEEASHETMDNIEDSVSSAEKGKKAAELVRDLSATTLVVGATFLTGGSAASVLAGGSALKGYGKYQTSGNIGAGVLEATSTLVVGTIAMAPALSEGSKAVSLAERVLASTEVTTGQRVALILVGAETDAGMEAGKSVIDSASAKEALQKAGLRFATDVVGGALGIGLDKIALPVAVRMMTDTGLAVGSDKTVGLVPSQNERAIPPSLRPVRDCHPAIRHVHSDEAYIRALVLKPA